MFSPLLHLLDLDPPLHRRPHAIHGMLQVVQAIAHRGIGGAFAEGLGHHHQLAAVGGGAVEVG